MGSYLSPSLIAWAGMLLFGASVEPLVAADWKFDFSNQAEAAVGVTKVAANERYDAKRGYGFLESGEPKANHPVIFSVAADEGNYNVTFRFGHAQQATSTTVKTESRRLLVERLDTAPGKFETRTFTVNVRRPEIKGGGATAIDGREKGPPAVPNWDEMLSFEFAGAKPGVVSLEITPNEQATTLYVAGDSTVTDQAHGPYAGWGQMLPRFFAEGVAVSNHAQSGLALTSFKRQRRLDKILSQMKPGDYLFVQFGHNDQKDKTPGAGPFTTYKQHLVSYVEAVRSKGGLPVLVTSMERRRWNDNGAFETLTDYAEAVRQVGRETGAPVIDLHAMSLKLYRALGPEKSTKAFVHYPAHTFPDQDKPLKDDTHHNAYGGYELARCMVEGIKQQIPALATKLRKDFSAYDPAHPDDPDRFELPMSPMSQKIEKPAGS